MGIQRFNNRPDFNFLDYNSFTKSLSVVANAAINTWKNALTLNGAGVLTGLYLPIVSSQARGIKVTVDGVVVYRSYFSHSLVCGLGIGVDGFIQTYVNTTNGGNHMGIPVNTGAILPFSSGQLLKKELPYLNTTDTTSDGSFVHLSFPLEFKTSLVVDFMSGLASDNILIQVNGATKK